MIFLTSRRSSRRFSTRIRPRGPGGLGRNIVVIVVILFDRFETGHSFGDC